MLLFIYYRLRSIAIGPVLPSADLGFTTRLLTGITAIPYYFRLLILPVDLHMERSLDLVQSFLQPNFLFSCIFVATLVVLSVRYGRRSGIVLFSAGWFAITLIPHLNIFIPINAEIAEHWLYLPSMGAALLLSYIVVTGYKNTKNRFYRYIIVCAVCVTCVTYAILTVRQTGYWRDERTFCEKTIMYSPNAVRLYTNLSNVYFKSREFEKAVDIAKQAIALRPKEYKRYSNLALIYMGMGEYGQAEEMMMKAIALEPKSGILYSNLGTIYMKWSKRKEAEQAYRTAVQIEPGFYQSHYNLGFILYESGRINEAVECFEKVEALCPGYEQTRRYLGK